MNIGGLINLGFRPLVDFLAQDDGEGPLLKAWLSALPQPSDAEQYSAAIIAYAADARWRRETGGIVVAGAAIATDRQSQAMISGAHAFVQANPAAIIRWKSPAGFVTLDAATVTAIALAVGAHVQACFAAEADVLAAIAAGTVTTTAEIDAVFAAL